MQENNSTDMQKNREHFLEKNILEQVKKKGNIRAILKCILKDDAFKDKNNITSDGYKLHIISNKSEDEKLKSSNVLLEAIVLSELFKANSSNGKWFDENLKNEYKRSEQGSQYFEIFQNAFKYIGLFKQKYSQTAFDNDTKDVFEKVKSMLSKTLTFDDIKKEDSLNSSETFNDIKKEDYLNFSDIENSDSSTVSAPQTPEKNGNDVKVEIKVDGVEEQNKNEIEAEKEDEEEVEDQENEEVAANLLQEEKEKLQDEDEAENEENEEKVAENLKKEEKGKRQDEGEAENEENEEMAANLAEEEERKLQDEKEVKMKEEEDIEKEKEAKKNETKDNLGEEKPEEPKENTENKEKSEEVTKGNQGEANPDEPKENNKDAQSEGEGLFWNVFGAIFSGIGLGGSIAAGATIVLGVGALAVLSGVGLILAGAAAATVGFVSLGALIYNLCKVYKIKNQRDKITNITILPDSYDSQSLQQVRDETEQKQVQDENKDENLLGNNNGNRKSSIFSSMNKNESNANNPIPKQGKSKIKTELPQYPEQ